MSGFQEGTFQEGNSKQERKSQEKEPFWPNVGNHTDTYAAFCYISWGIKIFCLGSKEMEIDSISWWGLGVCDKLLEDHVRLEILSETIIICKKVKIMTHFSLNL